MRIMGLPTATRPRFSSSVASAPQPVTPQHVYHEVVALLKPDNKTLLVSPPSYETRDGQRFEVIQVIAHHSAMAQKPIEQASQTLQAHPKYTPVQRFSKTISKDPATGQRVYGPQQPIVEQHPLVFAHVDNPQIHVKLAYGGDLHFDPTIKYA